AFIACLIFGLGTSVAANNSLIHASGDLLNMVPYLLTLIALAGLVGRSIPPAADGLPYTPGGGEASPGRAAQGVAHERTSSRGTEVPAHAKHALKFPGRGVRREATE